MILSELVILIIEDNPEDIFMIKRMLSALRHPKMLIQCAETLEDGIEIILKKNIDLVLLDLSLPDSQGIETLNEIRSKSEDLPIVILTGIEDEETAFQAIVEGAQDFIGKNWMNSNILWRSILFSIERQKMMKELKLANRKIIEQQKSLVEKERLDVLVQLAGATAHELNQPLTSLIGNIQLIELMDLKIPGKLNRYLNKINEAGNKIAEIVKKIMDLRKDKKIPYISGSTIIDLNQKLNILYIEDDDEDYKIIDSLFKAKQGIHLARAKTIKESKLKIDNEKFDLILLDYILSDGKGIEIIHYLNKKNNSIPVVVVSGQGNEVVSSKMIQEGAIDYIPKNKINMDFLYRIIGNTLEKTRLIEDINRAKDKISQVSQRDEFTGLYSANSFYDYLDKEWRRSYRYKKPISLLLIEFLCRTQDKERGHYLDDCIRMVAISIKESVKRPSDIVARLEGRKIGVLLPETSEEGVYTVIENIKKTISKIDLKDESNELDPPLIEYGHSTLTPKSRLNHHHLINRAENLLNENKARRKE